MLHRLIVVQSSTMSKNCSIKCDLMRNLPTRVHLHKMVMRWTTIACEQWTIFDSFQRIRYHTNRHQSPIYHQYFEIVLTRRLHYFHIIFIFSFFFYWFFLWFGSGTDKNKKRNNIHWLWRLNVTYSVASHAMNTLSEK